MALFNQYSTLFLLLAVGALGFAVLLRGPGSRPRQVAALVLLAVLSAAFFWLQPGGVEQSAAAAELAIGATGRPVLLEVYSDY